MGTISKKIEKEITFFNFEDITSKTIDELIEFCELQKNVIISYVRIDLINNRPNSIDLGINIAGNVIRKELNSGVYYFFRDNELNNVIDINDINWW